jgi:dTMP kinase
MYQGIRRGDAGDDLRAMIDDLHNRMIGVEPDLTVLIDIDAATGHSRAVARAGLEQRFEDMGSDMQARMRAGFLDLAAQNPARFAVINGARTADAVAADVLTRLTAHLNRINA